MQTTSISLLERLCAPTKEEAAWVRFVDLYTPLLFRWARRLGLQAEDAADVVQDVLAALLAKLPDFTYDPNKSFRAWLRTVTINRCRDRLRAAGTRPMPDGNDHVADLATADHAAEIEEEEYRQYIVSRSLQLMQSDFDEKTWRAAWEHGVHGRPAAQVAAELGMSVAAVYCARSRVLSRLREELHGLLDR